MKPVTLPLTAFALSGLCLSPDGVFAQQATRAIFASRAQGLSGGQVASVIVWEGNGTTINFIPTGELIRKAWLDDLSRVVFDDEAGCLRPGGSRSNSSPCGARVIHLRRIKPLNFPNLYQSTAPLLTLVAEGPNGDQKLYQFRIELGKGPAQYHALTVYPDSRGETFIELGNLQRATASDIEQGMMVAEKRKLLRRGEPLWGKISNFIALIRTGESPMGAAQAAGISMSVVNQLAQMGKAVNAQPLSSGPAAESLAIERQRELPAAGAGAQAPSDEGQELETKEEEESEKPTEPKSSEEEPRAEQLGFRNTSLGVAEERHPGHQIHNMLEERCTPIRLTPASAPLGTQGSNKAQQPDLKNGGVSAVLTADIPVARRDATQQKSSIFQSNPTPEQALRAINIPVVGGGYTSADALLAVEEDVWSLGGGRLRAQLAKVINALIQTGDVGFALKRSGMSEKTLSQLAMLGRSNSTIAPNQL